MSNPLVRLKSAKYVKTLSQEKIRIDSNQIYLKKDNLNEKQLNQMNENENEMDLKVNETWLQVEKQIKNFQSKYPIYLNNSEPVAKAFKTIRVFVSSTFTDFFNEREILVKRVFPELREWCFERNLDLIECDLRWGVPKDTPSENTILTCLHELDRCYEENSEPFFIGLLGEKYGWVPDMSTLSNELKEKYNWLPDISITFMEFLHGALRSQNKNACFFIRSLDSLKKIPAQYHDKFFETNLLSQLQMKALKEKLKEYYPNQVFDYSAEYEGIDSSTGRDKVKLGDLIEFGQLVLKFLIASIQRTYPDIKPIKENDRNKSDFNDDLIIQEDSLQNLYINDKLKFYINRELETYTLLAYINDKMNKLDKAFYETEENLNLVKTSSLKDNYPLILLGDEGCGKTSTLAYLANLLKEKGETVFYHFYEATLKSNEAYTMAARLMKFSSTLNKEFEKNYKEFLESTFFYRSNIFKEFTKSLYKYLSDNPSKKVTIIIDGFEKYSNNNLDYILRGVPKNVRMIYSCIKSLKHKSDQFVEKELWFKYEMSYFDLISSKIFVEKYLEKYNKKFDEYQMEMLLSKSKDNYSPLWLILACNELRIFGEFTTVTKKIEQLPENLNDLISMIITRIDFEFANSSIKDVLCLLAVSQYGLPESEAYSILLEMNPNIDRLQWSQILISLKPFLRYSDYANFNLINFVHDRLRKSVNDLYLKKDGEQIKYDSKLVDFFENKSQYNEFSSHRCIYHYKRVNDKSGFVKFLRSKKALTYLQAHVRSFTYNELRCNMMPFKEEKYQIKICFVCSNKIGPLSLYTLNKNSCFMCGNFIFNNSRKNAYVCLKHQNFFSQCSICRVMINDNNPHLKPTDAKLCDFCIDIKCCSTES